MSLLPGTLSAESLELRRWSPADLPELMVAIESSIDDLSLWMHWASDGVPSIEDERNVLITSVVNFDDDVEWSYSVFELATGELVGGGGLQRRSTTCLEIGYWVRSDRHRRGYATMAARCLTDAGFAFVADADRMEIRMDQANAASARVPAKLGYQLEGDEQHERLARGHTGRRLIWSMTRDQWLLPPSL